jgi:hypothetical protein
VSEDRKTGYDLTGLEEPIIVHVGDKTYTADPDASAVLIERVVAWCQGLLTSDEEEANRLSVELVALSYNIERDESAEMKPRVRRRMLSFFVVEPVLRVEATT